MLDIPLDLYKIFCAVARHGNMSAAARELYLSQPAVSMAMRQLETRLGKPLLIRSAKGVRLSQEGAVLYEYLRQGLDLIEAGERKYEALRNLSAGEVRIGASDTLTAQFLMPHIEAYMRQYPAVAVKVTNRITRETVRLLKSGAVDIGFVNLPIPADEQLVVTPCLRIWDCLIGGRKYRHLAQKGLALADLAQYPLILLEQDSSTRRYLDACAARSGIRLAPVLELGSSDLLLRFAAIDAGLAFVIRPFADGEIDNGALFEIPLIPPLPPRAIGLIRLAGVPLCHAAEKFVEQLIKE